MSVNLTPANTKKSISLMPWMVWGLGCLFYLYECLLQVSPSVMAGELMRAFNSTGKTLGILSGVYFYSYAAMQLPAGILMDYFGPKRILTLSTLICATSTLVFATTTQFEMACLARFMIGFGSAFAAIGTMKLAANWFPVNRFAFLTGVMVTLGMLGAIGGEAPLALLVDTYGWRDSMWLMGEVGVGLAIVMAVFMKDSPKQVVPHQAEETGNHTVMGSIRELVNNKQLWFIACYGGLMYMSTPVFCGLWGVPFLTVKMQIDKTIAAHYVALVFFGWAIASPIWGIISNRIGLRKPPMYIASAGSFCCSLVFIYLPVGDTLLQIALFLFGIFSAGFLPAFAVAKEVCHRNYVATGLGFMNTMNMVGIALVQPLIGFVLDMFWQGNTIDGIRQYALSTYMFALTILPLGMLSSLLILPFIKETFCKSSESV